MTRGHFTSYSIESKLKTYSAIAAGVLATASVANAQIIYTDIDPDIFLSDSSFLIDLNNDVIADFEIRNYGQNNGSTSFYNVVGLQPLNNNEVLGDSSGGYVMPAMLNANDTIAVDEENWFSDDGIMYYYGAFGGNSFKSGNWENANDNYLALRIKIKSEWHYGWARLEITSSGSAVIIKDYAYESYPGKHIIAGMQVSSISDDPIESIRILSGPENLIVNTNGVEIDGNEASVFNTMGQRIKTININPGHNLIPLEGYSQGIYILTMTVNGQPLSKQFTRR